MIANQQSLFHGPGWNLKGLQHKRDDIERDNQRGDDGGYKLRRCFFALGFHWLFGNCSGVARGRVLFIFFSGHSFRGAAVGFYRNSCNKSLTGSALECSGREALDLSEPTRQRPIGSVPGCTSRSITCQRGGNERY